MKEDQTERKKPFNGVEKPKEEQSNLYKAATLLLVILLVVSCTYTVIKEINYSYDRGYQSAIDDNNVTFNAGYQRALGDQLYQLGIQSGVDVTVAQITSKAIDCEVIPLTVGNIAVQLKDVRCP